MGRGRREAKHFRGCYGCIQGGRIFVNPASLNALV